MFRSSRHKRVDKPVWTPNTHKTANHHGGSIWDQVSSRSTCQTIPHPRPFRNCWRLWLSTAMRCSSFRLGFVSGFCKRIKDAVLLDVFIEAIIGHQAVQRAFIKAIFFQLRCILVFPEDFADVLYSLKGSEDRERPVNRPVWDLSSLDSMLSSNLSQRTVLRRLDQLSTTV